MPTARPPLLQRLTVAVGWCLLGLTLGVGVAIPVGVWLAVQDQPATAAAAAPTPQDIQRAARLWQGHDPRGKLPGITRHLVLTDRDLTLLAQLASNRLGDGRSRVSLHADQATLQASLPLPPNPLGHWLNLEVRLADTGGLPSVATVRIGRLWVPGGLVQWAVPLVLRNVGLQTQVDLAHRLVSQVRLRPGSVMVAYAWPEDLLQSLAEGLLPAEEQARVAVYTALLNRLVPELARAAQVVTAPAARPPQGPRLAPGEFSMAQLLAPVFALARQRSTDSASAALENRAALTALALVVNTLPTGLLNPGAAAQAKPGAGITLQGRQDTPMHFLLSAALSAKGGAVLSDAFGLFKELSDSRGGSGFSFNDMAADRAGTRLGQMAMTDPLALQSRLADGVKEGDLLPPMADLPEDLNQREFLRRFGGVGSPAYQLMMQDIENRLNHKDLLAPRR